MLELHSLGAGDEQPAWLIVRSKVQRLLQHELGVLKLLQHHHSHGFSNEIIDKELDKIMDNLLLDGIPRFVEEDFNSEAK